MAALAGVPRTVIDNARRKLEQLERQARSAQQRSAPVTQLDLFLAPEPHPVVRRLETLDVDGLSPREALNLLFELKRSL